MEFECTTLHFPADYDGPVVATLIRAVCPVVTSDRAVLYIHGYIDYFFQEHMAREFVERGYNFYAVDLRKYGRSLLEGQHPNFCRSLREYYPDVTESIRRIVADGNREVVLLGHSTGGLLAALYADDGPAQERGVVGAVVLNSPFLEFNASGWKRRLEIPAAARHFIAEVTQNGVLGRTPPYGKLGKLFQENGVVVKRLIIRFTGLFDTVSSHGTNFSDDVETLQLHKVSKSRFTVQLAAADEYRKYFALTRIGSCGGRGLELFLPGAHADIGGGYRMNDAEEQDKLIYESSNKEFIEKLRKKLIDEGWYEEGQITLNKQIRFHGSGHLSPASASYYYIYSLTGKRKVTNNYAHIPLHIMQELTDKYTREKMFDVKKINLQYKIVGLSAGYDALKKYVDDENKVDAINAYASYFNTVELHKLRNEHLHWSADASDWVYAPNVENDTFIRIRHEDN